MKSIKNTSRIVLIKSCFHSVSRGCRRWRKFDLLKEASRHFCSLNSPRIFLVRNHFPSIFHVAECHVRCLGHRGDFSSCLLQAIGCRKNIFSEYDSIKNLIYLSTCFNKQLVLHFLCCQFSRFLRVEIMFDGPSYEFRKYNLCSIPY